jgi:AcrR family transcriptional regulator
MRPRTIQTYGVEHLTLRAVGERLGVSRSALYRHFADKQSLLATVGKEGFGTLRQALADAWEENGRGRMGFEAMGRAYVQFAVAHPSHYRVMFGGFLESAAKDDHFVVEAKAAFQVLVDALIEQQKAGGIRRDDPVQMAACLWSYTAPPCWSMDRCPAAQTRALSSTRWRELTQPFAEKRTVWVVPSVYRRHITRQPRQLFGVG